MSVNRTLCSLTKYTRNLCSNSGGVILSSNNSFLIQFESKNVYQRHISTSSQTSHYNKNTTNNSNSHRIINSESSTHHQVPVSQRNLAHRCQNYTTALSNMTKDQANELVFRLNDQERQLLYQVLTQFQSNQERKKFEGKSRRHSTAILITRSPDLHHFSVCLSNGTITQTTTTTTNNLANFHFLEFLSVA